MIRITSISASGPLASRRVSGAMFELMGMAPTAKFGVEVVTKMTRPESDCTGGVTFGRMSDILRVSELVISMGGKSDAFVQQTMISAFRYPILYTKHESKSPLLHFSWLRFLCSHHFVAVKETKRVKCQFQLYAYVSSIPRSGTRNSNSPCA